MSGKEVGSDLSNHEILLNDQSTVEQRRLAWTGILTKERGVPLNRAIFLSAVFVEARSNKDARAAKVIPQSK